MTIPEEKLEELERLAKLVGGEQVLSLIDEIREQRKQIAALKNDAGELRPVCNDPLAGTPDGLVSE